VGASGSRHEAWVDIVCPECGETTSSSVYQARRSEELRCRNCDASISLRSEELQRELDRAEREWQAERERQGG
jgi:transcription elongation factor Elf1